MFEIKVVIKGYDQEYCCNCERLDNNCPFAKIDQTQDYDADASDFLRFDACIAAEIKYKNAITMGKSH